MSKVSEPDPIRVAVVDDHPLYRQGVVSTIDGQPDLVVIGEGASAAEAISICERELPEVILLDVRMPGTGLAAAAEIAEKCPATRVVMLTVSEDEDDVLHAFRVGARAYVLKGVSGDELTSILRLVSAGEVYVPPQLASRVLVEMTNPSTSSPTSGLDLLSNRERQILEGVASGYANKEVAYHLGISEKTVKHYMTNILQKLQARNRVEAALLAHDAGMGQLPERTRGDG